MELLKLGIRITSPRTVRTIRDNETASRHSCENFSDQRTGGTLATHEPERPTSAITSTVPSVKEHRVRHRHLVESSGSISTPPIRRNRSTGRAIVETSGHDYGLYPRIPSLFTCWPGLSRNRGWLPDACCLDPKPFWDAERLRLWRVPDVNEPNFGNIAREFRKRFREVLTTTRVE